MNSFNLAQTKKDTKLSYLGGVTVSQKIIKSQKVDNIMTYCVYLAPYNLSGYNVCSHATAECKMGCLASSGRSRMEYVTGSTMIYDARVKKTKLFYENNELFMQWLIHEITMYQKRATKKGMGFNVRLNGTSDIDWANVLHNGKNIFETFPTIQFYDYTKNYNKVFNVPSNYHLTLSYTGYNWHSCEAYLKRGGNVAMIFNIPNHKPIPKQYKGIEVINGDITDARVKDKSGVIVGLHWKIIANKQDNETVKNSVFCIQPDDIDCQY